MSNGDNTSPNDPGKGEDFKEEDTPPPPSSVADGANAATPLPEIPTTPPTELSDAPILSHPVIAPPERPADSELTGICADPILSALKRESLDGHIVPFLESKKIYLSRRLGSGGMGAVYLGQTQKLRKEVAVKILNCGNSVDPSFTARFKLEALLAAQVRSPHLVEVDDADEELGLHYIVMQFVYGKTAAEWLSQQRAARKPVPEMDALTLCIAATQGLATLHHKQIVHRDIKPGNIFIPYGNDEATLHLNEAKLGDLGLARKNDAAEELTVGSAVTMGTPGYVAPEQIRSSKLAGKPADVFSMGATLYTLLAGRQPWTGDSTFAVLDATINRPFEPLNALRKDVSAATLELIAKCLQKDPEKRYKDGTELLAALQAIAAVGTPVTRLPSEPTTQPAVDAQLVKPALDTPTIPAGKLEDASCKMASDENVQFTVYRPKSIQRETWTPLLAFAHLSEKAPDAAPGTPDPIAEVQRQAAASLGARANDYANLTHDSKQSVPRKGLISFVPEMEGATFDPPSRSFFWTQPTHREEFLIKADSASTGRTLRGQLTVYCGPLLLAEVPLAIKVEWAGATQPPGDPTIDEMDASRGRPYRKIFASYSNGDLPIVEACAGFAKAIGDDFLSRNVRLRSGEEWGGRLRNMIEDADVFQLFWSENAAKSPLVLQEIQHALSLSRQNFVRPTFWQPQLPCEDAIPAGLKRMHFERLPGIVVPLVEPPKAPATVLLPPPVIAPPASVIKPPPEIKPAVKPIQPPVGPPAVKAPQDAQSLPPPQPRFAPPPPHSPAVKPVAIEPQRPVSRPVVNDSPPVKARSRPLVSKLLFLAPVVAVVTIVMVLRGYFSGGDASQNRTTSMAPGDVAQNAPPLQPKSNSDPRLTLPSGAGQNPPIIPGAVRPARYSFRLLSNATPGSVILHSAALKKELRAFDLAMTIGGAKLSGDERVNKLNANEADLAVVSLGPVSSLAANADAFHGAARSIVLILSESATASALVTRVSGPRFLDQLSDGNALVFARGSAEELIARTSLNAFKYSQLPPRSDDVASVEDIFNRLRTTTSEWPTHLYAMPESLAFQAERNRGRILIESAGMDALLISAKLAAAHPNELADFLKAYFKTLASIDTPTGGIENAIVQNSSATPSDAQRLAAHTRWLNATENYTRFGLAAEPTMLALPERLRNDQPLRELYRAHFHASAVEANRQSAVAELSEQQWRNVRKIAELRDTIGFSRGSDELTAARESDLKDIAAILNLFPECYVIIRGNNYNDRDVAKKRAELVKTYLNQKCAVDRNRMYTEVPLVKDDTAGVSFLLVKPRT